MQYRYMIVPFWAVRPGCLQPEQGALMPADLESQEPVCH